MEQNKIDIIKQYLKKELKGSIKEEETETPETQSPAVPEPETPAPITFESNPLEFILQKYPTLKDTLVTLLTDDFRDYVTGINIIAPRPTKFKIVLHNNRSIYLTYLGKTYEATISGKRYYLSNLGDIQRATMALSDLLTLGQPKEDLTGPETESGPTPPEGSKEKKPKEGEKEAPALSAGEEEVELKESYMKQQTNEVVKAAHIGVGDKFVIAGDMGKFVKGDKVEVTDIQAYGNDVKIYMTSSSGTSDFIIVDKNDDSIDLDYSVDESKKHK